MRPAGATHREPRRNGVRIAIVIALCLLVLPLTAEGAQIFEKVGTLGGQSLKMGVGARANAMGDSYVAIADDASAVYWNPAGISRLSGQSITLNHTAWPADVSFDQAGYVFNIKWIPGMLGVNVRALTMSRDIVRTTYLPDGNGETFDAGEWTYGLSYARSLTDKFSAGFNINYVQTGLDEVKGKSVAFDFGTLYDVGVLGAKIGMAIQKGRSVLPELEIGVCGEHAADPGSVDFFVTLGVDYVSCSPSRVPIIRLAAAQSALKQPPRT